MLWTDPVFLRFIFGWLVFSTLAYWLSDAWWKRKQKMKELREGRVPATYDVTRG